MKFEKLNYSSGNIKKAFIIGFIVSTLIFVIINIFFTKAKYKLVESRKLASGTINYTLVDFELAGIKVKKDGSEDYVDTDTIEDNYVFNQNESYCTEKYTSEGNSFEDVRNNTLTINFDKDTKKVSIKPYSKKGTKCYLFFDEEHNLSKEVLENTLKQSSKGDISKIVGEACGSCTMKDSGIYKTQDDFGDSYVYRGTVDNNWVKFGTGKNKETGDIWWRIIRINGNGTIRLIYAGTSTNSNAPSPTGETTMIKPNQYAGNSSYPRAVKFNEKYNDNKYVGYMYNDSPTTSTQESAHNVTSSSKNSTILDQIVYWYNNDTNLSTLSDKIDVETGFCSDTNLATGKHGSYTGNGYGTSQSGYAGLDRVWQANSTSWNSSEQTPTLKCGTDETSRKRDLYTGPSAKGGTKGSNGTSITGNNALPVPVGLITMDEVIYAGGFGGKANSGYWLYTNQYYWTMSPSYYPNANVFIVRNYGHLGDDRVNNAGYGVRPVINLKANTTFTFDDDKPAGTTTNPYVVETS